MRAIIEEAWRSFHSKGGSLLGGAVAFYSLLSVAPILVIALRLASIVVGRESSRRTLFETIHRWAGPEAAMAIIDLLHRTDKATRISGVFAFLVLIYASTRLFTQLKQALNQLWGVPTQAHNNLKARLRDHARETVLGLVFVVSVAAILLTLFFIKTALVAISMFLPAPFFWHATENAASVVVVTFVFVATFRWLPDAKVSLADATIGGFVTAVLFSIGSAATSIFLAHRDFNSAYGPAGATVMLLLWVHYSAQVFFLGAAFTAAWAKQRGGGILRRAEVAL